MGHRAITMRCTACRYRNAAEALLLPLLLVLWALGAASAVHAQETTAPGSALPLRAHLNAFVSAYVNDYTATLAPQQRQLLEFELAEFEQRTGSPIAILMVPTTRPETIEQYSIRIADEWGLGHSEAGGKPGAGGRPGAEARKNVAEPRSDSGILIVVAKNDRRVRLEIGAALQATVPDVRARFIVDESITPRFRTGDYAGGLRAGVDDLLHQIGHRELAAQPDTGAGAAPGSGARWPMHSVQWPLWWMAAFLAGLLLRSFAGRLPGSAAGAMLGTAALLTGHAPVWLAGLGGLLLFSVLLTMIGTDFPVTQASRYTWRSGHGGLPGNWQDGFGLGGLAGNGSGFGGGGASGRW